MKSVSCGKILIPKTGLTGLPLEEPFLQVLHSFFSLARPFGFLLARPLPLPRPRSTNPPSKPIPMPPPESLSEPVWAGGIGPGLPGTIAANDNANDTASAAPSAAESGATSEIASEATSVTISIFSIGPVLVCSGSGGLADNVDTGPGAPG